MSKTMANPGLIISGGVVHADVDHATPVATGATDTLDVDPGLAERLADIGQRAGAVLHQQGQVGCHVSLLPRTVPMGYADHRGRSNRVRAGWGGGVWVAGLWTRASVGWSHTGGGRSPAVGIFDRA